MPIRNRSDVIDDPAITTTVKRLPEHLYKYHGVTSKRLEWIRALLLEGKLHFPRPSSFNDPLDCKIPPDFSATKEKRIQFWREAAKRQRPDLSSRERKQLVERLVRHSLTKAGRAEFTEQFFQTLDEFGILCLSKDPVSMLMWSYYAAGHKGLVLRFTRNWALHGSPTPLPVEVRYFEDLPRVSYYESRNTAFLNGMFGSKAKAWQHEQEWRFIYNSPGEHITPPNLVDGIILGVRTEPKVEKAIRAWIEERETPTELLRVQTVEGKFELKTVPT